jgi:BirA family biotin operon repressor/biotin-[acetyl-CoA-carboxylase] ligase
MPFDLARYHSLRRSRTVGVEVVHLDETGSTMDDARTGAEAGRPVGTAYVAAAQTAGRGRQGRSWVSEPGAGLWVTFHLRPGVPAGLVAAAAALAVADALEVAAGLTVDLKWPNDILYGGRKLCGILAEARPGAAGNDVMLGIGVNLRTPAGMPPEVLAIATSIEQEGRPAPSREVLLAALSTALERRLEEATAKPHGLLAAWSMRLVTIGRRVRVEAPGEAFEGLATGVDETGALRVRLDDGSERVCVAGDVHLLDAR